MSSTIVVTVVVIAAIAWLAFLAVSALRSRGPEEIPANLRPGVTDDEMETRRLERTQQLAVLMSAFLAVGLPLYYLGEPQRQDGFVHQFDEESVERGAELVVEYGCFTCHGPDGVGGVASYVEERTGVTVSWAAPSLDDVFYRYDRDEVNYWVTFGRGNTPMPPWGLEGGGPMNEQQVEDVVNYLQTIQVPQERVAGEVDPVVQAELQNLANADQGMEQAILRQRQVVAEIRRSPDLLPVAEELAARAGELLADLGSGIDTDGDGVADTVEEEISALTREARDAFVPPGLEPLALDPADPQTTGIPDRQAVDEILETMRGLVEDGTAPILETTVAAIEAILEGEEPDTGTGATPADTATTTTTAPGTAGEEGDPGAGEAGEPGPAGEEGEAGGGEQASADQDGDGLTDQQEQQISSQVAAAIAEVVPSDLVVVTLDPTTPQTQGGESDLVVAQRALNAIESVALNLSIQVANVERLLPPAEDALQHLLDAQEARRWEFDFQAIADQTFDGDVERARRVVGVFNGYCARCHTSGYSAGIPFAQEAGAGGFGPALWDGRPAVQFLTDDELVEFVINGSEDAVPYGVNGFGSGRMPAFGSILSEQDLNDLARWLRAGNLTGRGETGGGEG